MFLNRFYTVSRTSWIKAASPRCETRDIFLIKPDRSDQDMFQNRHLFDMLVLAYHKF